VGSNPAAPTKKYSYQGHIDPPKSTLRLFYYVNHSRAASGARGCCAAASRSTERDAEPELFRGRASRPNRDFPKFTAPPPNSANRAAARVRKAGRSSWMVCHTVSLSTSRSPNQACGSCRINRPSRSFDVGANERILNGCFHHEIDRPSEHIRQGTAQILPRGDAGMVAREISDKQVDIRACRVEVGATRGRPRLAATRPPLQDHRRPPTPDGKSLTEPAEPAVTRPSLQDPPHAGGGRVAAAQDGCDRWDRDGSPGTRARRDDPPRLVAPEPDWRGSRHRLAACSFASVGGAPR
jgi:hypothetical protein